MTRPYSLDLRERVVAAVEEEGLSRHQAAARFAVAVSTVVHWVRRYRTTGSVAPGKVGGHKKRVLRGEHADWLIGRCRDREFTISQLVEELLAERALKVDRRQVWEFLHAEGLSFKKKPVRQGAGSPGRRQAA
jgi:transposase